MADKTKSSRSRDKNGNFAATNKNPAKESDPNSNFRVGRELIESFAIALVLAFMFKSFLAEAYVIPTGSMGVTLMGAHKDVACTQCGYRYSICASEEYEGGTSTTSGRSVIGGTCPNCWYTMYFGEENFSNWTNPRYAPQPTFTGDRIIVNKSIYDFEPPERWDVSVFRYPGGPQTNFIKRLIGLENETVRLHNGDVFVRNDGAGETEFKIARKPSDVLLAMLQLVHDTEFTTPEIHKLGWPLRWAEESSPETAAWTVTEDYKSYACKAESAEKIHWLNYRHIIPNSEDWAELSGGLMPKYPLGTSPRLITDYNAYNAGLSKDTPFEELKDAENFLDSRVQEIDGKKRTELIFRKNIGTMGYNWTGDLCLSGNFRTESTKGKIHFRTVKGGQEFLCSIDLLDGTAVVSIPGFEEQFSPVSAKTPVRGPGAWKIRFANIDEQLRLWVDEKEIDFEGKTVYDKLCEGDDPLLQRNRSPKANDLRPFAVGVEGANISLDGIRLDRDIYYIAFTEYFANYSDFCDLLDPPLERLVYDIDTRKTRTILSDREKMVAELLSNPEKWGSLGKTNVAEFRMEDDQFLMLGDNSAKSKDGRLWTDDKIPHYVPREAMIGKAIAVYWPHGWPIPGTKQPFVPNFKKMRFIE